jgi:hypothetical protein
MKNPYLNSYVQDGFGRIEGYTIPQALDVLDVLDQSELMSGEGVAEVGVHHGQFFMALNCLSKENRTSYAIDVFDDQDLNIDRSGRGNLSIFKDNLSKLDRFKGRNTHIIQQDSTSSSIDLTKTIKPGSLRWFSVDGGHTAQHTINDLMLANQVISDRGVVVLDDIMHYCWLGVIEGAIHYLRNYPTLVPFAIGHNKLWMCKLTHHQQFYDCLASSSLSRNWPQTFVGHKIVTL